MPKVSKWSSHVLANVPLIFGQEEPRVARLTLSHAVDGDDAPAVSITLDREMAPLVARYQWRWDEMQRWAWAMIPTEDAVTYGLPNNRLYLHKLVAHAKRPTRETKLDYCNRPRIPEDVRFKLLEPIYIGAPRNEKLERVKARIAIAEVAHSYLIAHTNDFTTDYVSAATALLDKEMQLLARQRQLAIDTFDVTPEDDVIDDVGEVKDKMLDEGAIDDPTENSGATPVVSSDDDEEGMTPEQEARANAEYERRKAAGLLKR